MKAYFKNLGPSATALNKEPHVSVVTEQNVDWPYSIQVNTRT